MPKRCDTVLQDNRTGMDRAKIEGHDFGHLRCDSLLLFVVIRTMGSRLGISQDYEFECTVRHGILEHRPAAKPPAILTSYLRA